MKKLLFLFVSIVFVNYNCVTVQVDDDGNDIYIPSKKNKHTKVEPDTKKPEKNPTIVETVKKKIPIEFELCFWNVKNLSKNGLKRSTKGPYIIKFMQECDIIAFVEIRSVKDDMASEIQKSAEEENLEFSCLAGEAKGSGNHKEKYLTCVKKSLETELEVTEYPDENSDFVRPPSIFVFEIKNKKFAIVPFHSTPGDKAELTSFQDVVDHLYKNYSDRRIFFGGDFNTGKNYQREEFLKGLTYFQITSHLVEEGTTFANQKHDLIFTDPLTASQCKGKVWKLETYFADVGNRKDYEKISDHYPISAKCKIY